MQEAAIAAAGLVKRYGRQLVLGGLDWRVPAESSHALLAPPGAGKTLLLRLAVGFVAPDAGELAVLGHPPRRLPGVARRRVGYLPQRPGLRPELAIEAVLGARRAGAREWDAELERELRGAFGLDRARRVGELAAAERRGLELCLALGPRPALALLDEPCRDEGPDGPIAAVLRALVERGGTTLIATSSTPRDLASIAREVSIVHLGRLLEQAPIEALLREVRALRLPLERYARVAAAVQAAGIVSAHTEGEDKHVVVRRFDSALDALLRRETEGAVQVRALELDEVFAATVDVTSTGTGTRP